MLLVEPARRPETGLTTRTGGGLSSAEEVDGKVIFDPDTGWVNAGFLPYGEAVYFDGAVPRYRERDLMIAFANATPVPNIEDPQYSHREY